MSEHDTRPVSLTVGALREALAGRSDLDDIDLVVHLPRECCPGHEHDETEFRPQLTEVQSHGALSIHLKDLAS